MPVIFCPTRNIVEMRFRHKGVLTDPRNITVTVTPPTGDDIVLTATVSGGVVTTSAPISRISQGVYEVEIDCDSAGEWMMRTVVSSGVKTAGRHTIFVRE